ALKTIYSLIWDDFCSWYLEWVKPQPDKSIEPSVYRSTVRFFSELMHILHPFMPFVTEEIYHLLEDKNDDLCTRQYKPFLVPDPQILHSGTVLKEVITGIRDARIRSRLKQK